MSDSDSSSAEAGASSSKALSLAERVERLSAEAGATASFSSSTTNGSGDVANDSDSSGGSESESESGLDTEPSSSWGSRLSSMSHSSWSFATRSTSSSSHRLSSDGNPLVTDPARLLYKDPMLWFSVFCLVIPTVRNCADLNEVFAFYTNKALLICVGLGYVFSQHIAKAKVSLSLSDRLLANWALVNGCFFHLAMDGMSGWLKWLTPMAVEYERLDRRFLTMDPAPVVVTIMEVFWHMPACLLAYRAIVRNHNDRQVYTIVMAFFQLAGCVVFYGSEMWAGLVNLPTERPIGGPEGWFQNAELSLHHLIYFWFATVFCVTLWVVVPVIILKNAYKSIVADFELSAASKRE